jgi:hypothetical protein
MKVRTRHCDPHRCARSFIVTDTADGRVHVREWDLLTPSRAEEVADVELSAAEYARVVASHGGDEAEARHAIIADVRRHVEGRHTLLGRLVHRPVRMPNREPSDLRPDSGHHRQAAG